MMKNGPLVQRPDKRQYVRVVFTRTVKLSVEGQYRGRYRVRDLSLGGLFIEGKIDAHPGLDCRLELHETGRHSSLILDFEAKIIRTDQDGLAVEFINMEEDSYMFLQTMVLYSSDDPVGVAQDFLEGFDQGSTK